MCVCVCVYVWSLRKQPLQCGHFWNSLSQYLSFVFNNYFKQASFSLCTPNRCLISCLWSAPRTKLRTVEDREFCVHATKIWNRLSQRVISCASLSSLKTHIFKRSYASFSGVSNCCSVTLFCYVKNIWEMEILHYKCHFLLFYCYYCCCLCCVIIRPLFLLSIFCW